VLLDETMELLVLRRQSIDGIKALLTEHPFSAVPLSRVIGPRKRPVLAAPPPPRYRGVEASTDSPDDAGDSLRRT